MNERRRAPRFLLVLWISLAVLYLAPFVLVWAGVLSFGVDTDPGAQTDYLGTLLLIAVVLAPPVLLARATRGRR